MITKKLGRGILVASQSWHVIAIEKTGANVIDHTAIQSVVAQEWIEVYSDDELIVECNKVAINSFILAAHCWFNDNGIFQLMVSEVEKETALEMFAAAYKVAIEKSTF